MKLSNSELNEFRQLLAQDFPDKYFTDAEVKEMAKNLIEFVECVYLPIPADKIDEFNKICEETEKERSDQECKEIHEVQSSVPNSKQVAKALKRLMSKDIDLLYGYLSEKNARRLVKDFLL